MDVDSSDSDIDEESIIRDFEAEGKLIINKLLPTQSCLKYENTYNSFIKWKIDQKAKLFDENVLIVYFEDLSKKLKPYTLWAQWSMLRTTLNLRHGININKYENLKTLLKNKNKDYKAKKSSVLTWEQVQLFLKNSEDLIYLCSKVILIFGICGAMRCQEICDMNMSNIEDTGNQFIVTVRDTKNYYPRNFVIGIELYGKVKDCIKLRPNGLTTDRFFLQYRDGVCTRQVIGKNKISEVPKAIAVFLKLKDPETYTGHCLRRTAATLLANSGANLTTVKQLGGWKSSTVAEGYIEHSLANRKKIFQGIINSDNASAKENIQIRTSPVHNIVATNVSAATSADTHTDDMDKYPYFDIDGIDDAQLTDDSNLRKDFVQENVEVTNDFSSYQANRTTKKRVIFQDIKNANLNKEDSANNAEYLNKEDNALKEVTLKSSFVQFHNYVIHHLVNNNYSNCDFKQ